MPWGISESAYAASDHTLAYQYSPQGVPRLALRRTPTDELVIAPYATALGALVAPQLPNLHEDVRAYALSAASVALLRGLKVWDAIEPGAGAAAATAVHDMLVHGDAPSAAIEFSAWEQRVGELAFITDAAALEAELEAALRFAPHVTRVDHDVPATLVAHCEGRAAASAAAGLGITFERSDYGQRAIAARLP